MTPARSSAAPWIAPATIYLLLFFLLPLVLVLALAFSAGAPGDTFQLTLSNFARAADPLYARILWRSTLLALATTVICWIVAYPIALAIRSLPQRHRLLVLGLVALPSWINLLVKNYAWIVLLRREGVINTLLMTAGVTDAPLPLLFNDGAVLIGLVHSYLPFMILPIYAALDRLDWRLVEAARDLGARGWSTFRHVLLPQTLRATAVGSALVFVPALSAFVTPDLLGGSTSMMIGTVIENQVLMARDWPLASALSSLVVLLVIGPIYLYERYAALQGGSR